MRIDFSRSVQVRVGAALVLGASLALAISAPHISPAQRATRLERNFPATLCPAALGGSASISLPQKHLQIRSINPKTLLTHTTPFTRLPSNSYATYVQGTSGIPIAFNSASAAGSAAVLCNAGGQSQWFIGGTAALSSQDILEVINSGLSSSNVLIYPYTSKGSVAPIALTVKANSDSQVSVASLAPGENSVAFNVVTLTGRVSSFLLDHRKAGLSDLGASYVSATNAATNTIFLGGLTNGSAGSNAASQLVRLLVPGGIDANISTLVYSSNGSFAPVGLSQLTVPHQKVVDVPLPTAQTPSPYGIEITSDQPIFASVLTSVSHGGNDFAWANSLTPLAFGNSSAAVMNFSGASPTLLFMGSQISVQLRWQLSSGARGTATVGGQGEVSWKSPGPIDLITINTQGKAAVYGGAILKNGGTSLSYLPLESSLAENGSPLPTSDIRTLVRATP